MAPQSRAPLGVSAFREDDTENRRDRDLVRDALGGDHDALDTLVRRHQRFLYNVCLRMLHDPAEAEDAAHEVLIKAVTKLSSFEGRSRFRT
jgi:DNA-directed RNA polymerase specialized sigma24 family protein